MPHADPALVELNRRNVDFSARQSCLMHRRLADPALLETAIETIQSELARQVPVRNQTTFEAALETAERAKDRFQRKMARAAAQAKRPDSLQSLILDIVRTHPTVGHKQLLIEIKRHERGPVITEVDENEIHFRIAAESKRGREVSKSSPISGLKARLTRARKALQRER